VALNLQGADKADIERGAIIARPETLFLTNRIDATFKYMKLPFKPIRNTSILRFHVATTQAEAKLILLDRNAVEPGEEVFTQYTFAEPIVVLPGDRYILRGSYAIQTLGGGTVLDILPRKHQRKSDLLNKTFAILSSGTLREKAEYHVVKGGYEGLRKERLAVLLGLDEKALDPAVSELTGTGTARLVGRTLVHSERFAAYRNALVDFVTDFHQKNPLKVGISKEELRTRLPHVEQTVFQAVLDEAIREAGVGIDRDKVILKSVAQKTDGAVEELRRKVIDRLRGYGLTPPGLQELAGELGIQGNHLKDLLEKLVRDGKVTRVKGDMYFDGEVIEQLKQSVVALLKERKEMVPADFKNLTGLSRKYMIPLLEYFDEIRLTIRTGDKRVLRS
jgi:selenocysteine-specific elongation factor